MAKTKTEALAAIPVDALCPRCLKQTLVQFPDGFISCEHCGKVIAPALPEVIIEPPKEDNFAYPAAPVLV